MTTKREAERAEEDRIADRISSEGKGLVVASRRASRRRTSYERATGALFEAQRALGALLNEPEVNRGEWERWQLADSLVRLSALIVQVEQRYGPIVTEAEPARNETIVTETVVTDTNDSIVTEPELVCNEPIVTDLCAQCGTSMPRRPGSGRRRTYCSNRCRQRAHRARS